MANTKSAKKRINVTAKKELRNKAIKSRTRTAIKKAVTAIQTEGRGASEEHLKTVSIIDKAATKGVLHKNTAARRKARLARLMNKQA